MRLLLCSLAFASVAVSFGMAKIFVGEEDASSSQWMSLRKEEPKRCQCDVCEDLFEILGIRRSKIDWPDVPFTPEDIRELYTKFFPEGNAKRFSELFFCVYEILGIRRSATKYKIDWSDIQLTPEDLFEVYTKLLPEGNGRRFSEHVVRAFDSDNSGRIDIKEGFLVIDNIFFAKPEQKLEWAFQLYDVNGDGTVEPSETTDILGAIYDMLGPWLTIEDPSDTPERNTQEIFAEFDENNDGVLSKDEFIKGCLADEFTNQILNADFGEWFE